MSLRTRMVLLAGVAVAIAAIAVAVASYEGTRSELQGQVDDSLQSLVKRPLHNIGVGPGGGRSVLRRRQRRVHAVQAGGRDVGAAGPALCDPLDAGDPDGGEGIA